MFSGSISRWINCTEGFIVAFANTGVQGNRWTLPLLDSRFRGNDE
jgi:hypothetical protein